MQGSNKLHVGSSCIDKPPRVNWPHHANAVQSSSSKDDFLSSSFLFSLPTQRPNQEANCKGMLSLRSAACKIQGPERLQVQWIEKAWRSVCNTQVACKSYLRPGLSAKVKDCDRDHAHTYGTSSSYNFNKMDDVQRNMIPSDESMHQCTGSGTLENNSSHQLAGINSCTRTYQSNPMVQVDTTRTTNECSFARTDAKLCQTAPVADKISTDDTLDAMDDDEILASIDVDRIVMEHYQATNTPRGSASWQMSTPSGNKCNFTGLEENSLPQELSEICNHGFKLAFCSEAKYHLQDMKDQLIAISNELIDGSGELSPQHSEELRHQRAHIKKQIQLLGEYMTRSTQDDERRRSHSMSSTTATQGNHLPMTPRSTSLMDTDRFQSQVYMRKEPGNSASCYSTAPYTYMDSFSTPLTSVQRDYTRWNIDISYTDGSGDKKWSSTDFPWTKELEVNNKRVFGNRSFHPNQREIINATMSGSDVFVLMPTGGGKSLTYQLPALIDEGVTLVVCPLVSLIQDQIMHLLQANIPATYLSASLEWSEQQEILRDLLSPTCTYKLLYVTPEKIAKSDALLRHLENLYSRGHLSRIVIDEAHCVSQWGHDFRPDYQHLGILKQKFPETPVLALTATATASVKEDVVQALGLANCVVFRQSFNRPNLRYVVMPKTKKCLEDIDSFIRANHPKECGIIYCLSRMDCEKVAEKLRECGHKASHYHGSMDPTDRADIQRRWSMDKISIICATVAFGMGINKPDVRFVIHHSLPKSIEGYHQECGRAGRDGQRSSCVLYYNYSDYIRVKHMITQGVAEQGTSAPRGGSSSSHGQALETHKENLLCMVSYCENDVDCRRLLQLIHFGETFDPSHCAETCDNCMKGLRWIEKDVTNIARKLVELVMMTRPACSTSHILEVYRGSMNQNVKKHRHDTLSLHGAGKNLAKGEAARVIRHLVTEGILIEDVKKSDNMYGSVSSVLKVNQTKVGGLRSGNHIIVLKLPTPEKAPNMGKLDGSSVPEINKTVQRQNEVDENLSSLLYETLRYLRSQIAESTAGCGVHHIFKNETLREISIRIPRTKGELLEINGIGKMKLNRYGDRVLATIEDFLNQFPNASKRSSSGGSNEQTEAAKKRRGFTAANTPGNGDDFEECSVQSKKRVAMTHNAKQGVSDAASMDQDVRFIDLELDGCEGVDDELCNVQRPVASGRVLPKWPTAGTKVMRSRKFVGVAHAGFEDAMDCISEFPDTMNLAHKQKISGETMEEKQESTSQSILLSFKDEDFLFSGSSKLRASTSEETAVSGKMAPSESRKGRSGNNGTSKVPRMSSVLGTAGMVGFGRAVEMLDTLGCMMTTLSPDGGFISRATKGCQISILAFEVANTILKGASIMQSLSEDSVTYFKQMVLPSEGVQNLVSSDMGELMRIAANDKRQELKIFTQEIVRFGNRCKDPQWHNLDRYFVKLESERLPQKQLKETATAEMQKLMALVQRTTDLYHELHALDRFEQDYFCQLKGKESSNRSDKGDNIQVVRLELKTQRSYVKSLKKRSLWSKTLEDVVEKLVDIVQYLHVEINVSFGSSDGGELSSESTVNCQRLGPAGLALHYANTIIQIYSIVSRSGYVPANSRDALYQGLPPRVRSALPNKLRTSSRPRELTIDQIRAMMEKILKWFVPMAINTTCARGFLRFSEWAKSGTERVGRGPGRPDVIETLYHADKARTEAYILELVVWLHHLISQSSRPPNGKDQSI